LSVMVTVAAAIDIAVSGVARLAVVSGNSG